MSKGAQFEAGRERGYEDVSHRDAWSTWPRRSVVFFWYVAWIGAMLWPRVCQCQFLSITRLLQLPPPPVVPTSSL
jgi:hypothetical protein